MQKSPTGNLVPLDLKIEATLRRNRAERIRKLLQDRTVASTTQLPETVSMEDEQHQKITLEDYSSSLVPQFFTSIAHPEVQAHNINYPRSLIHLI